MKWLSIIITLFISASFAYNKFDLKNAFTIEDIAYIYDGDTFTINHNSQKIRIRLLGVDTPEIKDPKCAAEKTKAKAAKQFVVNKLRNANEVILLNIDKNSDKYGRWLADVYVDNQNLATMIIAAKLGRPYDGGKRQSWCN